MATINRNRKGSSSSVNHITEYDLTVSRETRWGSNYIMKEDRYIEIRGGISRQRRKR